MVVAISGFYVGLYVVFKGLSAVFSSPKKAEDGESAQGHHRVALCFPARVRGERGL